MEIGYGRWNVTRDRSGGFFDTSRNTVIPPDTTEASTAWQGWGEMTDEEVEAARAAVFAKVEATLALRAAGVATAADQSEDAVVIPFVRSTAGMDAQPEMEQRSFG